MSCPSCPDIPSVPVSYTLPDCPGGSNCEEYSFTDCVKYSGPNLPSLTITNGMTLKEALVVLNLKLTESLILRKYTITVGSTQSTTVVEYINEDGVLATASVSSAQSPQIICAQEGSPVKMSGTGVLSGPGNVCPDIPN